MEKRKVIVYVDGYNFYYGLKHGGSKWKRLYWLDVIKFFERMMLPDQELVEVNYYSARPVDDPQAYYNQDKFFQANEVNHKFKLHLGLYKKKKIKCQNCGFKIKTYEEHALTGGSDAEAAAYVGIEDEDGNVFWGAGIDDDIINASVRALISAVNRMGVK
jgi:hypothetical protein